MNEQTAIKYAPKDFATDQLVRLHGHLAELRLCLGIDAKTNAALCGGAAQMFTAIKLVQFWSKRQPPTMPPF